MLSTFTVNDSGDAPLDSSKGPGETSAGKITLRSAIQQIDKDGGGTIKFGVSQVNVGSGLDAITASGVTIDGGNVGSVVITGGIGYDGLVINGGNATIQNLVINGFLEGIQLGSSNNTVQKSYVGTNSSGTSAVPNLVGIDDLKGNNTIKQNVISGNKLNGLVIRGPSDLVTGNKIGTDPGGTSAVPNKVAALLLLGGAKNNTIGGTSSSDANIISGNTGAAGVQDAGGSKNLIEGNKIGVDSSGSKALGNGQGIIIGDGAVSDTIGGTSAGAGNIISGNTQAGLNIAGKGTSKNVVEGNKIGTNAAGDKAVPNLGSGLGIFAGASDNTIGGTTAGAANVISGNAVNGLFISGAGSSKNVVEGNKIGTNAAGDTALLNKFPGVLIGGGATDNTIGGTTAGAANVISGNSGYGVQIDGKGTSKNVVEGNDIGVTTAFAAIAGDKGSGLAISGGATGNTIGGTAAGAGNVISGNQGDGIDMFGSGTSKNVVEGNKIGTNQAGTTAVGNNGSGISIFAGASDNTIGGTAAGTGNVISGNQGGVNVFGLGTTTTGNLIAGNMIGTNATGTAAIANNGSGISISGGATNTTIGGTTDAARNVISGNTGDAVDIFNGGTSQNLVEGNYIGTNAAGTAAIANGVSGVSIFQGASSNTVGGASDAARNVISGNNQDGVHIADAGSDQNLVEGNHIGTDAAGTGALGNANYGVLIDNGAQNNTVGGATDPQSNVISANRQSGVGIVGQGTSNNVVLGNKIGTNAAGDAALGNANNGVAVFGGATNDTIGGTTLGDENVISGNGTPNAVWSGVAISDNGTSQIVVAGNKIGTNAAGDAALPNIGYGISVFNGASGITIGGTTDTAGNLISGNSGDGIALSGVSQITIKANKIGTNDAVTAAIGNGGSGLVVDHGQNITVGAIDDPSGNVISGNAHAGIAIQNSSSQIKILGNKIGVNSTGTAAIGNGGDGLIVLKSSQVTIGGTVHVFGDAANVISGNGGSGVELDGGTTLVKVLGNMIGVNAKGTAGLGNSLQGVRIGVGSQNTIGGGTVESANVISANLQNGVVVEGTANKVQGNNIGTDALGASTLGNVGTGVYLNDANLNTIGGSTLSAGNLISGNGGGGIVIRGANGIANKVQGNVIGLDQQDTRALANGGAGVAIYDGATKNTIGGTTASAANVISGNQTDGVAVSGSLTVSGKTILTGQNLIEGNKIGTSADGKTSRGNGRAGVSIFGGSIQNTIGGTSSGAGNVIASNKGDGVDISGDGTSENKVEGNLIGPTSTTPVALVVAVPSNGVSIFSGATDNTIGGTAAGAGNVISGNSGSGVAIGLKGTVRNLVEGNLIGTDSAGTSAVPNGGSGVSIYLGATDNTIGGTTASARNVVSGNQGAGITLFAASRNLIEGNYVGVDSTGSKALGNKFQGVVLFADNSSSTGSADNTIGGTAAGAGNVIAGNASASSATHYYAQMEIDGKGSSGNLVQGNLIGTDVNGDSLAPAFSSGGFIGYGATDNTFGGTTPAARNVISGSSGDNFDIYGEGTSRNVVEGNFIGTDPTGTKGLTNGRTGVEIYGGASGNTIGGTVSGAGNVIAFNQKNGVTVGSNPSDSKTIENAILGNSIHDNAKLGIDLGQDGVTINSAGSAPRVGPNLLINTPVLLSATTDPSGTTIRGTLRSTPDSTFRVEFFANDQADPSGRGQGQRYLGFANVTTDSAGDATFSYHISAQVPVGSAISATSTDSAGNTSEFAADLTVTPTQTAEVTVRRGGYIYQRSSRHFIQFVTLTNTGTTTVNGPIEYVLDNLSPGVSVFNSSGTTDSSAPPAGSPYLTVLGSSGQLAPNEQVTFAIEFVDPKFRPIFYTSRVLVGGQPV